MIFSASSRPPWFPLPASWRAFAIDNPDTVLLETAGGHGSDHRSFLFHSPKRILLARSASELIQVFADLAIAQREGLFAAGCMHYEAGSAFRGLAYLGSEHPIACFGIFDDPLTFDHHSGRASGTPLPASAKQSTITTSALITPPKIQINAAEYAHKIAAIHRLLESGDTYQVNFTTRVTADLLGTPLALYEALIDAQPLDYAAVVHLGEALTLSFSPELFFRIDHDSRIITRPMKGTAPRGATPEADMAQCDWLRNDEKNCAEHVMIVDLLRNDVGRICETGSVRTDDLFHVEAHPTVFQMTSNVSGTLSQDTSLEDIFRALFPSGSITGAPKRRTMEIIREFEPEPRGVYTGAIGYISPAGTACFSVPIRTLDLRGAGISMGVGGGIVADSTPEAEYAECELKAAFLNCAAQPIQLIETLLWDNDYPLLELHMERLSASATALGFRHDPEQILASLMAATLGVQGSRRVRLLLSADGTHTVETAPLNGPSDNLRVRLSRRRLGSLDAWLQHKTTHRRFYDRELARARADGYDEVLFLNEREELAEGAISNLFVEVDGRLFTPPLTAGVLPGVLRRKLIAAGATERTLRLEDLRSADAVFLGNALRGLRSVGCLELE